MEPAIHKEDARLYEPPLLVLRPRPVVEIAPDQLLELSSLDRDLRLELTANLRLERISGDPVLAGFVLDLRELW